MSGKLGICQSRAEFVRKLTEIVTEGAKIEYFSPGTTQKWEISHNSGQIRPKDVG